MATFEENVIKEVTKRVTKNTKIDYDKLVKKYEKAFTQKLNKEIPVYLNAQIESIMEDDFYDSFMKHFDVEAFTLSLLKTTGLPVKKSKKKKRG